MSRALPKEVRVHLEKAADSALLAVEVYNKPAIRFRSGGYIVLMCIAWTSLFHAICFRKKIKPFYRKASNPKRFEKIDGDYKAWELSTCLDDYFGGLHSPVRENLRFLIGLRNKIEHRSMPELDHHIFGECQACLFNFEDLLLKEFGAKHAINDSLALALQFSHLRDLHQAKAIASLQKPMQSNVRKYVEAFRSGLSTDVLQDMKYSFRVFLIPKIANNAHQAELAVEFVKYDPAKPDEMARYEKVTALLKPSVAHVVNAGCLKAADVCRRVEPVVKAAHGNLRKFGPSYQHPRACLLYKIRPPARDPHPEKTDVKFCHYDAAHKDYVYTEQWVQFLGEELKKQGKYDEIMAVKMNKA